MMHHRCEKNEEIFGGFDNYCYFCRANNNKLNIAKMEICIDNVCYTVEEGHAFVSSYDGVNGVVKIASSIPYEGKVYPVTSIREGAFRDCEGLTSIEIPNSVTSIGSWAFYGCSRLTSVTIPNSVTSIEKLAFYGCTGLTSVSIPNSVTSIGVWAFYGCTGLTSVTIPNSVTSIEISAFSYCSGLTSVIIPNSVTSIGVCAFRGCKSLTSVTIPNSVTSIGDGAFEGCTGLKNLTIHNNRPPVADSYITSQKVYDNCVLYVPEGSENAYYVADGWKYFKNIQTIGAVEKVPQDVNGDGIVDTQDVLEIYKYMQEH